MMTQAGFASLSPTLLARKGAARPAMRPQVQPLGTHELHAFAPGNDPQDELGWNDMGEDVPEPANEQRDAQAADVIALAGRVAIDTPAVSDKPEVVREREQAAKKIAAGALPAAPRRKAIAKGRKAAFTLRIDPERHLKLRLACTLKNRSAQQLITEALDCWLDAQDEIAEIAAHVGDTDRSN
ncbi:hypothetical protein [Pseudoblastomonas halimionae]|uniref:Uncharacterized protein n=1 Tax=Alteriqipengyuania halimionae TaxID=1926630 RepID=A0A6I4TYP3_9SPHN|nr:hypothetical protein [Alteriqipengyuania halimionae]MXP08738.1 hypothetical protein [Alteriqipengyuania halimionae]